MELEKAVDVVKFLFDLCLVEGIVHHCNNVQHASGEWRTCSNVRKNRQDQNFISE
jgi:hypothetical protein